MRSVWIILVGMLSALPALGQEPGQVSDDHRQSEELAKLVARAAWAGAESAFGRITVPNGDDWLLAAEIARARGDVQAVVERLERARELSQGEAAQIWLQSIAASYRRVTLAGRNAELSGDPPPFSPDHAAAVSFASAALADTGRFEGYLPVGAYVFGESRFELTVGEDVVSVKARRGGGPQADATADVCDGSAARLLQALDGIDGAWKAGGDVGAFTSEARAVLPCLDALPAPAPRARSGSSAARAALWTTAGLAAGAGGAFYALASSRRSAWRDTGDQHQLDLLRADVNRFATLSLVSGGLAIGFGVGGFVTPR